MIKIDKNSTAPASLALERDNANGSYTCEDVIQQLNEDFYGKCYLCEIKPLQSIQVEHLIPHRGDKQLKFDWNNLFLSCPHCNSVKNKNKFYNRILNCCTTNPEDEIEQQFTEGHVDVSSKNQNEKAIMTAELLQECFESCNTGIRILESQVRIDELSATMNLLYRQLNAYKKNSKGRSLRALQGMLEKSYKFAGFTRTYVRMHLDDYPGLAPFVK